MCSSDLKEAIKEREMTAGETTKREKIVKGMKKSKAGFEERYPGRGEEVMYATATKQAMKEADQKAVDNEVVKILVQIYNVIKEAAPSMSQEIAGHLFKANQEVSAAINAAKAPGKANVGEDMVQEKNAYVMAAAQAALKGKKEFEFDGEIHPVKMDKATAQKMMESLEEALPVGVGATAKNIAARGLAKLGRMATLGMGAKQATAKAQGQQQINKLANDMYLALQRTMGNRPIEGLQGNQIANWINKNYDIQLPTNYPRRMTDQQVGQLFLKAAELSVQGGKLASGPTPIPTPGATDMSGVIAVITNLYNSTTN